jgi:hypothetical protein
MEVTKMTVIYADDTNKIIREITDSIDFKTGWVEFNDKEVNFESLIRIEE